MKRTGDLKPFAKRSLGQNFLVDPSAIEKIVAALDIRPGDTVVEIGPGRGALTETLVETTARIIALEIDRDLVPLLRKKFEHNANLSILETDVLEFDLGKLISAEARAAPEPGRLKLVANLPYYISTAVLQKLADQRELFSTMVLMFQREVVERITAPPKSSSRGFLTVLTEVSFTVERLFDVSPDSFRPQPKVWSSVVRLTPKPKTIGNESAFRKLISDAFRQKRKTIVNNLKAQYPNASEILSAADIDHRLRPEELTLGQWLRLLEVIANT